MPPLPTNYELLTMPVSVQTTEGHEVRVVTESDQLELERGFRRWLAGIVVALLSGAFAMGASYSNVKADVNGVRETVQNVKVEGTLPGRETRSRMDKLESSIRAMDERQKEILDILKARR